MAKSPLDKIFKILPQVVIDEMQAYSTEELQESLVQCESNISEQETAMSEDDTLAAAKLNVKDLSAGYRDAIKYQRTKQRFCSILLQDKGKAHVGEP